MSFKHLFFICPIVIFICSFNVLTGNVTKTYHAISDTSKQLLALYGEYIYNREKCSSCHIQTDDENSNLISLDGLGGRMSSAWHFKHLVAPRSMSIDSKMPAFNYLISRDLDKQTFSKIGTGKFSSSFLNTIDESWAKLSTGADSIQNDLRAMDINVKSKSEIIALIGYLQLIPKSYGKIKKDSVYNEILKSKVQAWNDFILDSNSIVFKTAKDNDYSNLKNGELLYVKKFCTACHGKFGEGSVGPNLTDDYWLHGSSELNIAGSIINGYPDRGMMSWRLQLTPMEVGQLVSYIRSLKGTNPKNGKEKQGTKD